MRANSRTCQSGISCKASMMTSLPLIISRSGPTLIVSDGWLWFVVSIGILSAEVRALFRTTSTASEVWPGPPQPVDKNSPEFPRTARYNPQSKQKVGNGVGGDGIAQTLFPAHQPLI